MRHAFLIAVLLLGLASLAYLIVGNLGGSEGVPASTGSSTGPSAVSSAVSSAGDRQQAQATLEPAVEGLLDSSQATKAAERSDAGTSAESRPARPERFSLRGHVVQAADGSPVPGFALEIMDAAGTTCRVVAGEDGAFETESVLHEGVATIRQVLDPEHPRFQFDYVLTPRQVRVPHPDPGTGLAGAEVLVQVTPAAAVILVRVIFADEEPAPGARVVLLEFQSGTPGRASRVHIRQADEDGLARFALDWDQEPARLELYADFVAQGLVSDPLDVLQPGDQPPAEPLSLVLLETGDVRVRVSDELGLPVPGARVFSTWSDIGANFAGLYSPFRTDEQGEYVLCGLSPGTHGIQVRDPRNRSEHEREIRVQRGVETQVEFHLPAVSTELAVAGRVVDEKGDPLPSIYISIEKVGEQRLWGTRADAEGRFELWSRPVPGLILRAGVELDSDVFEPTSVEVPFGTQDVVLRRARTLVTRRISVQVSDAVRGSGVPGAEVWIYAPDLEDQFPSFRVGTTGADGGAQVEFKVRDGLLWGVHAEGFLQQEGAVGDLDLEAEAPVLEVHLQRGFDRRWQITDWFDGTPLPGAIVRDTQDHTLLGTADEEGWVHLRSYVWPKSIEVSHPGHETKIWPTGTRNGWRFDNISLPSEKLQEQIDEFDRNRR